MQIWCAGSTAALLNVDDAICKHLQQLGHISATHLHDADITAIAL